MPFVYVATTHTLKKVKAKKEAVYSSFRPLFSIAIVPLSLIFIVSSLSLATAMNISLIDALFSEEQNSYPIHNLANNAPSKRTVAWPA
jgi:hypothetical protein